MKKYVPYVEKHLKEGVKVKLRNGTEGTVSFVGHNTFNISGVLTFYKENGICYYDKSGANPFDVVEIEVEAKLPKAKVLDEFTTESGFRYKIEYVYTSKGVFLARNLELKNFWFIFNLDGSSVSPDDVSTANMRSTVPFEV